MEKVCELNFGGGRTKNMGCYADKKTDIRVVAAELYLLPVRTRVPLEFGSETLTEVTCARVKLSVKSRDGRGR